MLTGWWLHGADAPKADFVVERWWAEVPAEIPLVSILSVLPEHIDPAAWRAHCETIKGHLDAHGGLARLRAVCVGEELYFHTQPGQYLGTLFPPEMDRDTRVALVCAWLDGVGIPIAREVFGVPVTVEEHFFQNERIPGQFAPAPRAADVLTVLAYAHGAALRDYPLDLVFEHLVQRPVLRALSYGKAVHVVGQGFWAPGDALWGALPPPEFLTKTRDFCAATPGVVALSWFLWDHPGLQGLKHASAAHRDAVGM